MKKKLELLAPAKVNLILRIVGKRPDGYHELRSLMVPISLSDELELELTPAGIELECTSGVRPVGSDPLPDLKMENNLAYRAARLLQQRTQSPAGVKIKLKKFIPQAAGLGGGSADAAAVISGLNHLWKLRLPREELMRLGKSLGADVPFFILGKPAIAQGIGEILSPVAHQPLWLVLTNPGFAISTTGAYKMLEPGVLTNEDAWVKMAPLIPRAQELNQLLPLLHNDFEFILEQQYPEIVQLKKHLLKAGAVAAQLTGSGPTVFGIFANQQKAQEAASRLEAVKEPRWEIYLTKTLS